jgi:hypothetical protein
MSCPLCWLHCDFLPPAIGPTVSTPRHLILLLLGLLLAGQAASAADPAPQAALAETPLIRQILARVDSLYRSDASHCRLEMEISTPNWQRRLEMEMWTRGLDETFIRILSPAKDAGITTLRKGTQMWNFFPRIDKTMKVPTSMMMSAWMGSDFTNDDLVKESTLIDDYVATEAPAPADSLRCLVLTPREQTATVWGRIELTVRTTDLLPVEEIYYDEKGTAMRRLRFLDLTRFGKRLVPATMELVPLNKPGHQTVIRYLEADFDAEPGEDTFSLRALRRR